MPAAVLLRTEQLTRAFGRLLAVNRIDVQIEAGELRWIIGPASGSTTPSIYFPACASAPRALTEAPADVNRASRRPDDPAAFPRGPGTD